LNLWKTIGRKRKEEQEEVQAVTRRKKIETNYSYL
jgi:hypothetical protein